jgi:hypothetical protein
MQLLASLAREQRVNDSESQRTAALRPLQTPPLLAETQALASISQRLIAAAHTHAEYQARGTALLPLVAPPLLADTAAAESLVQRLTGAQRNQQRADQAIQSLAALVQPPALANEQPLRTFIDALAAGSQKLAACAALWSAVQEIATAPEIGNLAPLADWLQRFDQQTAELNKQERELAAAQADSLATAEELRDWARQQQTCPTCGSLLDPERLVTDLAVAASTQCTGGGLHNA